MTSFPNYHLGKGEHDTFPVQIVCEKAKIWLFCVIGRETMVMNRCVLRLLIGCRISTKLSVRSSLFENKMADKDRVSVFKENEFYSALDQARPVIFQTQFLKGRTERKPKHIMCLIIPKVLECLEDEDEDKQQVVTETS